MSEGDEKDVQGLQMAIPKEPLPAHGDLEQIFRANHGLVFRAAYRVTGNPDDAEDVLQTVFLRLMRRERPAAEVENMEAYLRRSAVNAALDLVKLRRESSNVPLEPLEPVLADRAPAADRQQNAREIRQCVRRAAGRLGPRAGEIFALRYFEGHGNSEIARALGISQAGVAVTLHRARRQVEKEVRSFLGERS